MDYDLRADLGGLELKKTYPLVIEPVGILGALAWYVCHRDPNVYVPARLAAGSIALGIIGILLALCSIRGFH